MPDQPDSDRTPQPPSSLEAAEARKLTEALAELRRSNKLIDGSGQSKPELDVRDAGTLEAESLSGWVARLRSDAADRARATEEGLLKDWVAEAEAAAAQRRIRKPRTPKPAAGRAMRATPRKTATRKKPTSGTRAAPEGAASDQVQDVEPPPPAVDPPMAPIDDALARAQRALAWHSEKLLLRMRPRESARLMARAVASGVRASARTTQRLLGAAALLGFARLSVHGAARGVAGVSLGTVRLGRAAALGGARLCSLTVQLPLRFISDLDLAGLVGLLLAIMGVVAAVALLLRG